MHLCLYQTLCLDRGCVPGAHALLARLQVNYRGSTGFGKSFLHAGDAEWGVGAMQNDLTDSVEWAVQQGIADPKRVAIFGGSYGASVVPPVQT